MEQLLCTYLISHKQCPIPGIGRLVIQETPAQTNITDKIVSPPAHRLELEKSIFNETDLTAYVAAGKAVSQKDAELLLADYGSTIKYLPSHGTLQFGRLGSFYRDAQGGLFFKDNSDAGRYFVPVNAQKIIRPNEMHHLLVGDRQTTSTEMNEFYGAEERVSKKKWWIGALIILIVSVTLIVLHYKNWNNSSLGNHQPF